LQHTSENNDKTLGTNICNIRVQPLQHMKHPDLLLQHPSKYLQHTFETSETLGTYACNIRFSTFFFCMTHSRVGNGQSAAKDGGAAWQRPAMPAPRLGLASDGPLS
jgi:hypothetical protein